MQAVIVKSVVEATSDIFTKMGSMTVSSGNPTQEKTDAKLFDFTGIIGLSGSYAGSVYAHFQRSTAALVASKMLGMTIEENSEDVKEMVGELTNMIAVGMRNLLARHNLNFQISIPTVVSGKEHDLEPPANPEVWQAPAITRPDKG